MPCSLCGAQNVNKTTCPFNPESKRTDPALHLLEPRPGVTIKIEDYPQIMSPVQGEWFDEIVAQRKDVEGRASAKGKFDPHIGRIVQLSGATPASNGELPTILVLITDVRHYPDLDTYIAGEGWQRIAPHMGSNKKTREAYLGIMMPDGKQQVFSPERVAKRGGINGVELVIIRH